jgi:peptide/nickel transport system ATP-binding protein
MTALPAALAVSGLNVRFRRRAEPVLTDVAFSVQPGRAVALIGPSGSGKTTVCRAVLQLLPSGGSLTGSVRVAGTELTGLNERALQHVRGQQVAMVFQSPGRALDPTFRIGPQLVEALTRGRRLSAPAARVEGLELLRRVNLREPQRVFDSFAHELSGGMRQRVLIALAISRRPQVLIADEATAALDRPNQEAVLELLTGLQSEMGLALVLVSHDLALASGHADDVVVMDQGRVVDTFNPTTVQWTARPPATMELARSAVSLGQRIPGLDQLSPVSRTVFREGRAPEGPPLLEMIDVRVEYGSDRAAPLAGVHLDIRAGESVALLGESGAGKSTLAQTMVGLTGLTAGRVLLGGRSLKEIPAAERRRLQIVFQDPVHSFDPTWKVRSIVGEPLPAAGLTRRQRRHQVERTLDLVGLDESIGRRRPRQLSGGQAQLVAIARALISSPSLLIADEAVSALDPTTRSRILHLLRRHQEEQGMAWLMITHDLEAAGKFCDRILFLHHGRINESAEYHPHEGQLA